jgi:hypothetical protein
MIKGESEIDFKLNEFERWRFGDTGVEQIGGVWHVELVCFGKKYDENCFVRNVSYSYLISWHCLRVFSHKSNNLNIKKCYLEFKR